MKRLLMITLAVSLAALTLCAGLLTWEQARGDGSAATFAKLRQQLGASHTAYAQEAKAAISPAAGLLLPAARQGMTPMEATDDPILLAYREMAMEQPDMVGWIKIEGTAIDYPVMRTPQEPEKYLHLDFDGRYSRSGTPFMLPSSDPSQPNGNIIIYGHHMKDGSMFAGLAAYDRAETFLLQPYITFDTLYGRGEYLIVAVFRTSATGEDAFAYHTYEQLEDEETFERFMRGVKANSLYDTGVDAVFGDELLSLSTCDYHEPDGRLVIVAKRITDSKEDIDA